MNLPGGLKPFNRSRFGPGVSGYILEVNFQSGQLVKKGDLLFSIDPRWYQADFNQRQAEVDRATVLLRMRETPVVGRTTQLLATKAISSTE